MFREAGCRKRILIIRMRIAAREDITVNTQCDFFT